MEGLRRFLDHMIPSPCVAVCRMDNERKLCTGCLRTMEEISGWPYMNREQKLQVHANAAERRAALDLKDPDSKGKS